jgi:hypothetical protein
VKIKTTSPTFSLKCRGVDESRDALPGDTVEEEEEEEIENNKNHFRIGRPWI